MFLKSFTYLLISSLITAPLGATQNADFSKYEVTDPFHLPTGEASRTFAAALRARLPAPADQQAASDSAIATLIEAVLAHRREYAARQVIPRLTRGSATQATAALGANLLAGFFHGRTDDNRIELFRNCASASTALDAYLARIPAEMQRERLNGDNDSLQSSFLQAFHQGVQSALPGALERSPVRAVAQEIQGLVRDPSLLLTAYPSPRLSAEANTLQTEVVRRLGQVPALNQAMSREDLVESQELHRRVADHDSRFYAMRNGPDAIDRYHEAMAVRATADRLYGDLPPIYRRNVTTNASFRSAVITEIMSGRLGDAARNAYLRIGWGTLRGLWDRTQEEGTRALRDAPPAPAADGPRLVHVTFPEQRLNANGGPADKIHLSFNNRAILDAYYAEGLRTATDSAKQSLAQTCRQAQRFYNADGSVKEGMRIALLTYASGRPTEPALVARLGQVAQRAPEGALETAPAPREVRRAVPRRPSAATH